MDLTNIDLPDNSVRIMAIEEYRGFLILRGKQGPVWFYQIWEPYKIAGYKYSTGHAMEEYHDFHDTFCVAKNLIDMRLTP